MDSSGYVVTTGFGVFYKKIKKTVAFEGSLAIIGIMEDYRFVV